MNRDYDKSYGINRVKEPQMVLPTSAWKLDNSRAIESHEIRVDLKLIHIEGTSFRQILMESNNNERRIKNKILDIVIKRGKLHNPVTDTGGIAFGVISEIGDEYNNPKGLKVGDEVICNISLTSAPIYIDRINSIDRTFGQIEVDGYGIFFDRMTLVKKPADLPINLLLMIFNESGTLYRISSTAVGKKRFLVVGNNLLCNLIFGYAIRKVAIPDADIVCLLDKNTDEVMAGKSIEELKKKVFTKVEYVDILKPLESIEEIRGDSLFDLSVNCADIPGAETINILATKSGGTVIFANLINNYNIALYITELMSKELDIRCADGYLEAYDYFDITLVRELMPYIEEAQTVAQEADDNPAYPVNRKTRLMEASGQRQTMLEDFVCESHAMAGVLDDILTVAKYDCNVMITGDTGVGKEKVANIIQKNSSRKMQPLLKVNCASISSNLIESEFFGYEKGAFTGANSSGKKGYFEIADNGTIFLDEIGELQADMQAKLLRVIQDGEFFRVGGTTPIKTNVRIISATNRDIEDLIEKDLFRRDLYYRLNVVRIRVPSLKERSGDIPALIRHFIKKYRKKFDIDRSIDDAAVDYLKQCQWEGNIRELENVVQRLMISARSQTITLIDVMRELHGDIFDVSQINDESEKDNNLIIDLEQAVENFEKNIIKHAYETTGSTRKAAKALGISQTQLVRKKNKYGIV